MKKLFYCAAALATLLFAGSCQRENLEPVVSGNVVTYTVQVPGALATKAIGEDVSAVTELVYEVYRTEATSADDHTQNETKLFHKTATITNGIANVEFELINNQNFRILFWAQVPDNGVYTVSDLKNVTISQSLTSNAEKYAAFAGADFIKDGDNIIDREFTLTRPIAQINIGTDNESLSIEGQTTVQIATSNVTVNGLSTTFNVAENKVGNISEEDFVYSAAPLVATTEFPGLSEQTFAINGNSYNYVAMNYVGFAPKEGTNVDVTYYINTKNVGNIHNKIDNVPVKPNYRTNIVGNLITSMSDYTIYLDEAWDAENTHAMDASAAQAALDAANDGAIIKLEPGVNYGTLVIRPVEGQKNTVTDCDYLIYRNEMLRKVENLTIVGAPGATVDAITVVAGHIEGSTGYVVDIKNLVIDSVEFTDKHTNAPHNYAAPIFFDLSYTNVDGLTVKNCKLIGDNDKMNLVYIYTSGKVAFDNIAKNITIENNTVDGIARLCELRQTENVTITGNTIKNTALHGMLLTTSGGTYSGKVTITGNTADGINDRFVRMAGAGDAEVVITDNTITNYLGADADYIKVTDGTNVTTEPNTFDSVGAKDATSAQALLDNAVPGTTIQLQPGVAYGTLYMRPSANTGVTKVVDWVGNNYRYETYSLFENVTILGAEGATVDAIEIEGGTYYNTAHSQAATYPVMLSLVELKNVVIDGVTFTGKGGYDPQGYGNAINLSGNNIKVDGLTLRNCVLDNADNNARLIYKTEGTTNVHTYTYGGETYTFSPTLKDITVTETTFNGGYMGLELRETENVTITNNTFNVADRNILLPVNTGCTYSGNVTITGNVSNNAKERFVRADGMGDAVVVIKNNTINNYQSKDADYIKVTNANNVTIELTANTSEGLQSAIANAVANKKDMTIVLAEGTYNDDINLTVDALGGTDKNIVFKAAEGANPVIAGTVTLGYREQTVGAAMWNGNVTFEGVTFDHAKAENHSINVGDVKTLTLKNCKIIGDGEYGLTSARGNGTDGSKSKIVDCTFENAAMQLLGNLATGLVIDNCTFNKSRINVQGGNGVTVQKCTFNNTLKSAHVGDSFYAVRSNSTPIIVKNSKINIDSDLTEVVTTEQAKWYLLANRGTTNWTVENVAVTMTDAALMQKQLKVLACTSTGVINTENFTVNGKVYASTAAELEAAVKAGGEIALFDNVALTKSLAISTANFSLDGNGYSITQAAECTNTYALFDITGGKASFKNVVFDGVKEGAVIRTVGVEFTADNVTAMNGNHTQKQGLFRLMGKSTITNCKFENNTCNMVITLNYDGANNDPQVVENCVFEDNTCNATAVVYYVKGAGATINGNKFVSNTVNCSGNGATLYMGFTENNVITDNLFQDNIVNEAATSKRVAGGIMIGYEATITGNAFVGNKVTGTNAKANDVCASVYYTDIDLSGNYWGGSAPVEDDDYYVEYPDNHNVIINDYLTTNPIK